MELPYFGQDLESKKRVVEILAHVCPLELDGALGQEPIVSWSKQRSCCLWNAQKKLATCQLQDILQSADCGVHQAS